MPRTLSYEIVDVFTSVPFRGNPLAVVLDADDLSAGQMQALAREFNLSETSFPVAPDDDERAGGADYRLRIFTPTTELPFAGHPSLGAAWVLAQAGRLEGGDVVQACGAGLLPLTVHAGTGRVELTGGTPTLSDGLDAVPLLAAVGLGPADLAGPPPRLAGTGLEFAYLPVRPDAVARAAASPAAVRGLPGAGVAVFSWDGEAAHARVFAADVGVAEDPATGSAALGLGVYLVACGLLPAEGASSYAVRQGAEVDRPSDLYGAVLAEGGRAVRCRVAGAVVAVARGEIRIPDPAATPDDHPGRPG